MQITGKKTELFPRFHCGTGKNYFIRLPAFQRLHRKADGKVSFARTRGTYTESDRLAFNAVHVLFLPDRLALYGLSAVSYGNRTGRKFGYILRLAVAGKLYAVLYPASVHAFAYVGKRKQTFYDRCGIDYAFLFALDNKFKPLYAYENAEFTHYYI